MVINTISSWVSACHGKGHAQDEVDYDHGEGGYDCPLLGNDQDELQDDDGHDHLLLGYDHDDDGHDHLLLGERLDQV